MACGISRRSGPRAHRAGAGLPRAVGRGTGVRQARAIRGASGRRSSSSNCPESCERGSHVSVSTLYDHAIKSVNPVEPPTTDASRLHRNYRWRPAMLCRNDNDARGTHWSKRTDDRLHRGAGRRVRADRLEGHQRPFGRRRLDASTCRGRHPRTRIRPRGAVVARRPAPGGHLPRTRERVGARDRARRGARRRSPPVGGGALRDAGASDAGARVDRGRARPPADGRDRGVLGPERGRARAAPRERDPLRRGRSDRANRSTTRRRSGRPTGTAA